jgi:hypothetical protein
MGESTTSARKVHAEQRRALVAELRERGASYQLIADAVRQRFPETTPAGYDFKAAYRDVRYVLDRAAEVTIRAKAPLRALHTARLERMHLAFYDLALKGDNDAFAKVFKVLEREAKMWGLDEVQAGSAHLIPLPEHHRRCLLLLRVVQELIYARTPSAEDAHAWLLDLQQRLDALATLVGLPAPAAQPQPIAYIEPERADSRGR